MNFSDGRSISTHPRSSEADTDSFDNFLPFDEEATKASALIFPGTINDRVAVLMLMGDQVANTIKDALEVSSDGDKLAIYLIGQRFSEHFRNMKFDIHELTSVTKQFDEDHVINIIEKFARDIARYRKDVEKLSEPNSFDLIISPPHLHTGENPWGGETHHNGDSTSPTSVPIAAVPMTRICGKPGSIYITPKPRGIDINEDAYADHNRTSGMIPYDIDVNETYHEILKGVRKNLTYVGSMYPDGTSLSYLPVKNLTVLRRKSDSEIQYPTWDEGGVVELKLPQVIYSKIKELCAAAYLTKNPNHVLKYPYEYGHEGSTVTVHALARGYRRLRIIDNEKTFHVTLLQALQDCSHDMSGEGLVHLRFDRPNNEDVRATMKIIFFGLQLRRTTSNYFQRIFRL